MTGSRVFGLPSGINRNLANTTTPKPINTTAATPRQPHVPSAEPDHRQNSSNQRLDRPRSFMDDTEGVNNMRLLAYQCVYRA
jgi:hypothetical protein